MAAPRKAPPPSKPRRPPATTPEARENQLVAMAFDLAERQLAEGTASAQVITHYLKLGSSRERLEKEKIQQENELLKGRVEQLASTKKIEELYERALVAISEYKGEDSEFDYED